MKKFGIDVSVWQGNYDFNKAKKEEVKFVILKGASTCPGLGGGKDSTFESNYKKAKSVGLVRPYKKYGMTISANGILGADTQTATEYNNTSVATFIGKGTLENIKYDTVKAALCDGVGAAWTDAEKLAAQQRLGILSSEGVGF